MKKFLTLVIALTLLTACSGDDNPGTTTSPQEANVLLKKVIETKEDGNTTTYNYTYDGNKIVSIIGSNNTSKVFYYTGNLITKVKNIETFMTVETFIEYDSNNRVKTQKDFSSIPDGSYEEWQVAVSTYNTDGTITKNVYFGKTETDLEFNNSHTIIFNYEKNTLVYDMEEESDHNYVFDNKNNPMKNILGYFEYKGPFIATQNLLLNFTGATNEIIGNYTYNVNNYPVTSTEKFRLQTGEYKTYQKQYFYE